MMGDLQLRSVQKFELPNKIFELAYEEDIMGLRNMRLEHIELLQLNASRQTVFHFCIQEHKVVALVELIDLLEGKTEYYVGVQNGSGHTALEMAVIQNDFMMAKILLEKSFFCGRVLAATNLEGRRTALMWSILNENTAIAELLLDHGAKMTADALHTALECQSPLALLDLLLGVQPGLLNHRTKEGHSSLYIAVSTGRAEAVGLLLGHMRDPTEPVQGFAAPEGTASGSQTTGSAAGQGGRRASAASSGQRGRCASAPAAPAAGHEQPCAALRLAIDRRSTELVRLLLEANGEKPWPPALRPYLRQKMPAFLLRADLQASFRGKFGGGPLSKVQTRCGEPALVRVSVHHQTCSPTASSTKSSSEDLLGCAPHSGSFATGNSKAQKMESHEQEEPERPVFYVSQAAAYFRRKQRSESKLYITNPTSGAVCLLSCQELQLKWT